MQNNNLTLTEQVDTECVVFNWCNPDRAGEHQGCLILPDTGLCPGYPGAIKLHSNSGGGEGANNKSSTFSLELPFSRVTFFSPN